MATMRRYASTGYIVREVDDAPKPSQTATTYTNVRLPDGKLVKVVDRELFNRALRAAVEKKNARR